MNLSVILAYVYAVVAMYRYQVKHSKEEMELQHEDNSHNSRNSRNSRNSEGTQRGSPALRNTPMMVNTSTSYLSVPSRTLSRNTTSDYL